MAAEHLRRMLAEKAPDATKPPQGGLRPDCGPPSESPDLHHVHTEDTLRHLLYSVGTDTTLREWLACGAELRADTEVVETCDLDGDRTRLPTCPDRLAALDEEVEP